MPTVITEDLSQDEIAKKIQTDMKQIINSYLATAGLNVEGGETYQNFSGLYSQGISDQLNGLQLAIIEQNIRNSVDSAKLIDQFQGLEDEFNNAINSFVQDITDGVSLALFDTLKNVGVDEFKNSNFFKNLNNVKTIQNQFAKLENGSALYKAISEAFGEAVAEMILADYRSLDAYKAILEDIKTRVNAGEFLNNGVVDTAKIVTEFVNQMKESLNDFFPNGLADMSVTDLNNLYDKRIESAKEVKDDDEYLAQYRQAAIDYCDALCAKSNSAYKEAVVDVFGADYADAINNMMPSKIDSNMNTLKANANKIIDLDDITETQAASIWSGVKASYTVEEGDTDTFNIGNTLTINGVTITTDQIDYQYSGGCITVDDAGKATINGSAQGTYSTTVKVLVGGKVITSKTINVIVQEKQIFANDSKTKVNGDTIDTILLNNNNMYKSEAFKPKDNGAFNGGRKFITSTLDSVATSLKSSGKYQSQKIDATIKVLKGYYLQLLDSINNWQSLTKTDHGAKYSIEQDFDRSFTYSDSSGNTYSLSMDCNWKNRHSNKIEFSSASEITSTSGFGVCHSYDSDDRYWFYFNTRSLLQLFEQVYNTL